LSLAAAGSGVARIACSVYAMKTLWPIVPKLTGLQGGI
jgi:hypothetical protein